MNDKYDYILGIDPDTDKSGFALLDVNCKAFEFVGALTFVQGIKFLDTLAARGGAYRLSLRTATHQRRIARCTASQRLYLQWAAAWASVTPRLNTCCSMPRVWPLKCTGKSRCRRYGAHIVTARFPMPNCSTKMCRASPAGQTPKCGMRVCWPCTARLSR